MKNIFLFRAFHCYFFILIRRSFSVRPCWSVTRIAPRVRDAPVRSGHSTSTIERGSFAISRTPNVELSLALRNRYASMWYADRNGPPRRRNCRIRMNVGLMIRFRTPRPAKNPCANVVFPAPRSPVSAITRARRPAPLLRTRRASCLPRILVLSGELLTYVTRIYRIIHEPGARRE